MFLLEPGLVGWRIWATCWTCFSNSFTRCRKRLFSSCNCSGDFCLFSSLLEFSSTSIITSIFSSLFCWYSFFSSFKSSSLVAIFPFSHCGSAKFSSSLLFLSFSHRIKSKSFSGFNSEEMLNHSLYFWTDSLLLVDSCSIFYSNNISLTFSHCFFLCSQFFCRSWANSFLVIKSLFSFSSFSFKSK